MVNVTKSNFIAESNDLLSRLPTAAFIAIDEEMTGIMLPNSSRPPKDQTPTQRYEYLKSVPEKYSIIQLGVCLFHQHPEFLENSKRGTKGPEFVARRYNFYMFPPAENSITREVVLNPSSIAFLNQHNMNFDLWSKEGVPYVTGDAADELLTRFHSKQSEKRKKAQSSKSSSPYASRRGVELRRTEDINFHARAMASLREWLDTAHAPIQAAGGEGAEEVAEGTSFLLPAANSFLRRALYESIQSEYPSLILENAGAQYPNQIRVLRLSPEEQKIREQRLLREDWEDLMVNRIGLWRVFSAISLTCQGFQIPFDSVTFAESADGVNWERNDDTLEPLGRHIPIVVHNGLMDLLFLMSHFHSHNLPHSYTEMKALIHSYFPVVYDTKLLSTECTPPSLWNDATHLENLYVKVVRDDEEMHNLIELVPEPMAVNGFENLVGNDEQMHEAAYDAYMTGAVYVGLCRHISSRASDMYQSPSTAETHIGTLFHLLAEDHDEYVTSLFGRNKLYLMQSLYTIDLARKDGDPLSRGMIDESIFRVSDFDPSVTTRTIVQCLSGLHDSNVERVNFEIIWVDDTAFIVAATRKQMLQTSTGASSIENERAILLEHGDIILKALRSRFQREKIIQWNEYLMNLNRHSVRGTVQEKYGWSSRLKQLIWNLLGYRDETGEKCKREIENGTYLPPSKRRRII